MTRAVYVLAGLLAGGASFCAAAQEISPNDAPAPGPVGRPYESKSDLGPEAAPTPRMLAPKEAHEIGVEAGYTQPFGSIDSEQSVSHIAHAGGAVGLSYSYRFVPRFSLGVTGQFHESSPDDALGADAAVRGVAFGIFGTYHFSPFRRFDPYASLGTGYRMLFIAPPGTNNNHMIHGLELGRFTAGLDMRITPDVALGPMAGADVNLFLWDRQQAVGGNVDLTGVRPNTFVFAGVGGRFDLGGKLVSNQAHVATAWPEPMEGPRPAAAPPVERPVVPVAGEPKEINIEPSIVSSCNVSSPQAFFASSSMRVETRYLATLDAISQCLSLGALSGRKVVVYGYSDPHDTEAGAESVGELRAESVANYLKSHGVPAENITTVSLGKREAIGTDEMTWAYDRRVDIELTQ
jgi:outer membrane protein OmpA-like peptidoglycan-associated protein